MNRTLTVFILLLILTGGYSLYFYLNPIDHDNEDSMSTDRFENLIAGYKKFHQHYFVEDPLLYHKLYSKGQFPKTMAIACSDSRVSPSVIMNAAPGEIFIVRNVANLVPPYKHDATYSGVSSALEFAVKSLQVENIVVIGHSKCGGITALLNPALTKENFNFIYPWVNIAYDAKIKTNQKYLEDPSLDKQTVCEKESLTVSIKNLMTFPWIRERVENNQLKLHAWYFSIEDGSLSVWNENKGEFNPIEL